MPENTRADDPIKVGMNFELGTILSGRPDHCLAANAEASIELDHGTIAVLVMDCIMVF